MRPYGIVVYPQNHPQTYLGKVAEDGVFPLAHDDDDCKLGTDFPCVLFFQTVAGRDAELGELLKTYPGVMFCPITVSTGKMTQPNPQATEFTIDHRGVLPA